MGETVEFTWTWTDPSLATDLNVYLCTGANVATNLECSISSRCARSSENPLSPGVSSYALETKWGTSDTDFVFGETYRLCMMSSDDAGVYSFTESVSREAARKLTITPQTSSQINLF